MQPKYNHNKSNIIKVTEEAKRKSRQRLIGSIILLFFALVILLNVTAKVKPIPINPEVVEIKSTASGVINASAATVQTKSSSSQVYYAATNNASGGIKTMPASQVLGRDDTTTRSNNTPQVPGGVNSQPPSSKNASATATNGFKANIVNTETKNSDNKNSTNTTNKHPLPLQGKINHTEQQNQSVDLTKQPAKPKAKAKSQVNPEDILNGLVDETPSEKAETIKTAVKADKSYIQFAALSSEEKAQSLQELLANRGIHATVQPIHTAKGTLYRLRAGPYNRADAEQKLQQITGEGYSGIVTGN